MTAAGLPLLRRWLAMTHVRERWREPDGTRVIDQMIGEPCMVKRGHGSAFVRWFVERLLAAGVPRIVTDPGPADARAIRRYEKAGFAGERLVETPDGAALHMFRNASSS